MRPRFTGVSWGLVVRLRTNQRPAAEEGTKRIRLSSVPGADPDDTAQRLLAWMDDDPYGFAYDLEKDAAQVLDRAGLQAFEKKARARFDGSEIAPRAENPSQRESREYIRRRWGTVLRT